MGLLELMITMSVIGVTLATMWGGLGYLAWLVLFVILVKIGDDNG